MNSGCQETHGTAIAFRLSDRRVVLLDTQICQNATKRFEDPAVIGAERPTYSRAMAESRTIDALAVCGSTYQSYYDAQKQPQGFLIDNADQPAHWFGFRFGEKLKGSDSTVRLLAAKAQALDVEPSDALDAGAPGVVRTAFQHKTWWDSPSRILSYRRLRDNGFSYQAAEE
jgi:hypothetical protein